MIRYVAHADIDKQAWDERLRRDPVPQWYGSSHTLDDAAPGWDALIDEEAGQQLALPWRRKLGIVYSYQPFLIQQLGPYGAGRTGADTLRFLEALPARFRYADIYVCSGDAQAAPSGLQLSTCTDLVLPLEGTPDTLRAGYSDNHRRNLRKVTLAEEAFVEDVPVDELLTFFMGSEQFKRWRIAPRQLEAMERLVRGSVARGEADRWGVRHADGSLMAAACFIHALGRTIFLKGLADARGREHRAMHALLDRAIGRWAGGGVLDFAGSNDPELARFYAGFGARPTFYLRALMNRLPALIRRTKT